MYLCQSQCLKSYPYLTTIFFFSPDVLIFQYIIYNFLNCCFFVKTILFRYKYNFRSSFISHQIVYFVKKIMYNIFFHSFPCFFVYTMIFKNPNNSFYFFSCHHYASKIC